MQTTTKPYSKDFVLMVIGQIISIFGAALLRFVLPLYILDMTGRADLFGIMFAVANIPMILAPLGGSIADRFNRRNLMVIFDFTSSAIILTLFVLMGFDVAGIAVVEITVVLLSVISTLYTPAVTASIPLLVGADNLASANGIVQAIYPLSGVIAPILGGALYGVFGMRTLVLISAIAFFTSAVMEIFIKIPHKKNMITGNIVSAIGKDLKQGFSYVAKKPFILKSMVLAALLNFALTPLMIVGAPIILRDAMHSSDLMYGIGLGITGFTTVLGALLTGVFSKKLKINLMHRLMALLVLFVAIVGSSVVPAVLGLGYYPGFALLNLGMAPISIIATVMSIYIITKVQRVTPNENLGKVMAIIMGAAQCVAPLGQALYGILFERFSTSLYVPILAAALLVACITILTRWMFKNESDD